jgi:hypothetical protein
MIRERHTALREPGAFALEQAALQVGKGLADHDSSARGDNAVPGDGLTARASSHGSSGSASPARESRGASQFAVSANAPFRDALNQSIEPRPGEVHVGKDTCNAARVARETKRAQPEMSPMEGELPVLGF